MKLVIYSICKNEANFVKRFLDSAKDADKIIIGDTGSTDETKKELKKYPNVEVLDINLPQFRFDLARNIVLNSLPKDTDVAISADLDDVFLPSWRKTIENAWKKGETTLLNYPYIHAWEDLEQKVPRITIMGFKVHCPKTYYWQYPIHEILVARSGIRTNEKIIN
jgi:glycosyltransferase involved in cell wall biosynthesis